MKTPGHITSGILAAAALLLAGSSQIQATPNLVVAAFATGTQGENSVTDGTYGQYDGDCIEVPYGAGDIWWDGVTYDAADGSTGSAYITAEFSSANNTDVLVSIAPGYNNWYYEGGSGVPGWSSGTVDFTQYHAVQFDILWDNTSDLTIAQFNTGEDWNTNDFVSPAVGSNYMATNSYFTDGVNVDLFTGSGGTTVYLGTFQVPTNAGSGWQHVVMPYSDSLPGISSGAGLWFEGAFGGGSELVASYNAAFWIDNVQLVGNVTPELPPTVSGPTKSTPGLNIFNATEGNSFYDRNEVLAKTTSGLSWVGNTPTSYSFNLAGFPNGAAYSGESYMFLVPNSANEDNGADYNEATTMVLEVQSTPAGGQASLSYKVDEPDSETYTTVTFSSFTGPSAPATATNYVPSAQLLGTYTLTFTDNDDGTVTAPDGTTGTFSLPALTGETYFTEGTAEQGQADNYNFLIYLGSQANSASYIDKSVVYQSVTVSGPPNGATVSENFVMDANAPTPALQHWAASWTGNSTSDPTAVVLVPSTAPYWIAWSLPASGFNLAGTTTLGDGASWNNVSSYTPVPMYQSNLQLLADTDLPATGAKFYGMVQRTFSQLLVLLPGQTSTPGVAPGYTGTPTPVNGGSGGFAEENITVLAVDSSFNPITSVTDTINVISSTDGYATLPNPEPMVNGSVTFSTANSAFYFGQDGDFTITVQDTTTPSIPEATSASVVVQN